MTLDRIKAYGPAARCPAAPNSLLPLEQSWWRSIFSGATQGRSTKIYIDLSSTKPNINKHTANNSWASAIVLLSSIMGTIMGSCHLHRQQEAITLGPKSTELAVRAFGCPFGLRKTSTCHHPRKDGKHEHIWRFPSMGLPPNSCFFLWKIHL